MVVYHEDLEKREGSGVVAHVSHVSKEGDCYLRDVISNLPDFQDLNGILKKMRALNF